GDHLQPVSCERLARWGLLEDFFAAGAERRLGSRYLDPDGELVLHAPVDELDIPYPYYLYLDHERITQQLLAAAARNPNFALLKPANAKLLRDGQRFALEVDDGQRRRLRAQLIVAADGRQSGLRRAAGLDAELHRYQNPLLILFAPRTFADPRNEVRAYFGPRAIISVIPRCGDQWKIGWPVASEELPAWRQAGEAELGERLAALVPELAGIRPRLAGIYPVAMVTAPRWHRDNLVLLGDACHAMHPGRSQGMNIAIRAAAQLADRVGADGVLDDEARLAAALDAHEALAAELAPRLADNHARGLEMDRLDPAAVAALREKLAAVAADPARRQAYCLAAAGY
ncbi:MAG: hypothetical protein D6727_08930, partial [Gammaproteobacteria bacterium]